MSNKIGRNDQCPCGSGVKFKKCCFLKNVSSFNGSVVSQNKTEKVVLKTTTGETYMPIRLYYEVYNMQEFLKQLGQLGCVIMNDDDNFIINYMDETQNIGLSVKHNALPKTLYPIILAYGTFQNNNSLTIDLRSFKRGVGIIEFINNIFSREMIELTHLATYNKITKINKADAAEYFSQNRYNEIFDRADMEIVDPSISEKKLQEINDTTDETLKLTLKSAFLTEVIRSEIPEIRKVPAHYYEDGISSIESFLTLTETLAYANIDGQKISAFDLISRLVDNNPRTNNNLC